MDKRTDKLNYLVAEVLDTALSDSYADIERVCVRIAQRELVAFFLLSARAHAALADDQAIESYHGGCIS